MRAARLAPVYYLSLLIVLPYLYDSLASQEGAAETILVVLFLQAWWPPFAEAWNYPAWSLSVEAAFYVLFPWLFDGTARLRRRWLFAIAYSLIIVSAVSREMLSVSHLESHFPLFHLPLFIFGMALGRQVLFASHLFSGLHSGMFAVGTLATVLLFGFAPSLPWWTRSDPVLVVAFSLIIVGATEPVGAVRYLTAPVFVLLGQASYSIYLLHVPLRGYWGAFSFGLPPWVILPIYLILVVGGSVLVFRYIETPLRQWIGGREPRVGRVGLPACPPARPPTSSPDPHASRKTPGLHALPRPKDHHAARNPAPESPRFDGSPPTFSGP